MMQSEQDDLKSAIELALTTGATLALDYEQILQEADAESKDDPVIDVDISDFDSKPAGLSALSQVSGVLGGQSIGALVPSGILPAAALVVQNVGFKLFVGPKTVGGVSCTVGFFDKGGKDPLTWDIVTLDPGSQNPAKISVTLDTITLTWVNPLQPQQMFGAIIYGSATIGNLPLTVSITFPDFTLTIEETPYALVNVGSFFTQLKLPDVGFLDQLILRGFQLTANPGQGSFSVAASMETAEQPPLPLLTIGGTTVLGFDNMAFSLSHSSGTTSSQIGGQITILNGLVIEVQAALDTDPQSGSWTFEGDIDIAATWQNLPANQDLPLPAEPKVTVTDLMHIFIGEDANPPSALPVLAIAALSFSYTRTKAGNDSYALNGVFDIDWTIADLKAEVTVALGSAGNSISAVFDVEGIAFTLGYVFSGGSSEIDATIDAGVLQLSGQYDETKSTLILTFTKTPSLADFIGWLVGEITGNGYFALPDPWDSVLGDLTIPSGVQFKIVFGKDSGSGTTITCTVPINKSLLGFTLNSFVITYDPSTKSGRTSSGLSVAIDSDLPSWLTDGNWDPATQPPPKVPGSTTSLLDIDLLAAGQHIGFPVGNVPTTVEDAINRLGTALNPANWTGGLYPGGLTPSADIGWLIGTHVGLFGRKDDSTNTFKYQLDLQFIFNDPNLYGLRLAVNASDKSSTLYALNGLTAEIVYRKVSDTVGVYEGTLTLPSDIRKIDLNQVVITLPQFAVSIYTNGDFKFDAGFPYNRDFSQSLSVVAAEYSGAGGFYYAKLDGLDPAELPRVPIVPNSNPQQLAGVFSPVTEIGIGFEIGVSKGFSSGPLSASISIMLLGIFEGVFAKYTRYSDGAQDEFYSVDATLGIVGHLVGEIDFVIITASLEITVAIDIELKLIAHQQTVATVSAYVDVELTVSINCGLFTIHIHCGYSTTVQEQATFGAADNSALWLPSHAVTTLALVMAALSPPSITVTWQPIKDTNKDTNSLTLYFIPQLTAGDAYPSDRQAHWYYVGQLGLSNPTTDANGKITSVNTDPSYAKFIGGMVVFALNAINNSSSDPVDRGSAETKLVTATQIQQLNDLLNDPARSAWPSPAVIKLEFSNAFQTGMAAMAAQGNYGVGFFPAVTGMGITLQSAGQPAVTRAAAMLSPAQLKRARSTGPADAPAAVFLSQLRRQSNVVASEQDQPSPELILSDFVVLAIRSALGKILEKKAAIFPNGDDQQVAIKDIVTALQPDAGNVSGQTTRFMLHGTRWNTAGVTEPLYALLGQQLPLTDWRSASALTMTLDFTSGSAADWGMSFPTGQSSLVLSSNDGNQVIFKPSQIPATPSFAPSNVSSLPMPLIPNGNPAPVRFYLKTGIADTAGQAVLWQLPQALADQLAQGAGTDVFFANAINLNQRGATPTAIPASYVFTIDFRVRKIPDPAGGPALPNTYELVDVDQGGLQSLQTLVTGTNLVSGLALAFANAADPVSGGSRQAVITIVDFSSTFIVQSNFSTETRPPALVMAVLGEAPDDKVNLFLTKLWTAGITNSGGYFLFDTTTFPPALFDGQGVATLTLVASLNAADGKPLSSDGNTGAVLPAYVTAARILNSDAQGLALYLASDKITAARALLPAGNFGVDVQCKAPDTPATGQGYGNALDHLYNLLTREGVSIAGSLVPVQGMPPVFGPANPDGETPDPTIWRYRHVVPLVASWPDKVEDWPADLTQTPQYSPYKWIGQTAAVDLRWTDLFGNEWPSGQGSPNPAVSVPLQYTDPLIALSQLPYLSINYRFESGGGGPQLALNFAVQLPTGNVSPPQPPYPDDDTGSTRKCNDLRAYAQAYYQLADPNVAATITTSLLVAAGKPQPVTIAIDAIRNTILKIYGYLYACPLGSVAPQPPTLDPLTLTVPPNGTVSVAQDVKYPLTVALALSRPAPLVATPFQSGPVESISTTIAPLTAVQGGDAHSLASFAKDFENAFQTQQLVIAVGPSAGEGLSANSRQVWVVHYGASGLNITIHTDIAPANFAPRPLSNQLQSTDVQVHQFDAAQGKLSDTMSTVTVTNVDLDAQMQKFLSAVDLMFSATDAIPAALIDTSALNGLSSSKQTLVDCLVGSLEKPDAYPGYITDLNTGTSYADGSYQPTDPIAPRIVAAVDRYRQECLIRLSSFYDMDAVTVPTVSATFGVPDDPGLYLFGHLAVDGSSAKASGNSADAETGFSLTSGKCALATTPKPMAFGLFAKHVSAQSVYACTPSFVIDAIQHDVTHVSVDNATYDVGGWLTFVIPRPALTDVPALAIPIVLRAFPQPPQLMVQSGVQLLADRDAPPSDGNADLQLLLAKTWALKGTYQHTFAAQDTVHLKAEINVSTEDAAPVIVMAAEGGRDLIDTLIDFNLNYPPLQAFFAANHLDSIRDPQKAKNLPLLTSALNAFATLVNEVAISIWPKKPAPAAVRLAVGDALVAYESQYQIQDGYNIEDMSQPWQCAVSWEKDITSPLGFIPQLQIDGWKTVLLPPESGQPDTRLLYGFADPNNSATRLIAAQAEAIPSRTVAVMPPYEYLAQNEPFTALDIVDRQNGLLSMMIGRNEGLPAPFQYQTAWVTYTEIISPTLDTSAPIDIAGIGEPNGQPVSRSIADHLTALFKALAQVAGTSHSVTLNFQATISFAYPPNAPPAGEPLALVELPIALLLPAQATSDIIADMAKGITNWLTANGLSSAQPLWARAEVRFDLSLFSDTSLTGRPTLRLRNLFIPCKDVV